MDTDYTADQIAAAARLVPEYVPYPLAHGCAWQPWADTEAGSADWAVLDTAVKKWWTNNPLVYSGDIKDALRAMDHADFSGDLNKRKAATFAAAVAIGAHMKGVEGE